MNFNRYKAVLPRGGYGGARFTTIIAIWTVLSILAFTTSYSSRWEKEFNWEVAIFTVYACVIAVLCYILPVTLKARGIFSSILVILFLVFIIDVSTNFYYFPNGEPAYCVVVTNKETGEFKTHAYTSDLECNQVINTRQCLNSMEMHYLNFPFSRSSYWCRYLVNTPDGLELTKRLNKHSEHILSKIHIPPLAYFAHLAFILLFQLILLLKLKSEEYLGKDDGT